MLPLEPQPASLEPYLHRAGHMNSGSLWCDGCLRSLCERRFERERPGSGFEESRGSGGGKAVGANQAASRPHHVAWAARCYFSSALPPPGLVLGCPRRRRPQVRGPGVPEGGRPGRFGPGCTTGWPGAQGVSVAAWLLARHCSLLPAVDGAVWVPAASDEPRSVSL